MSSRRAAHHITRGAHGSRGTSGERRRKFSGGSPVRARGKLILKMMKRYTQRLTAGRARTPSAHAVSRLERVELPGVALLVYAIVWLVVVAGFISG
jgi:hypothetical protein